MSNVTTELKCISEKLDPIVEYVVTNRTVIPQLLERVKKIEDWKDKFWITTLATAGSLLGLFIAILVLFEKLKK
jgi:hypothetical protein